MKNDNLEQRLKNLRISNEESKRITRESIQTALIELMSKSDFEKISITDLVKKSGVSRAAFYRNYKNKEDVLKDFSLNILRLVASTLEEENKNNNLIDWFKLYFTSIKANRKIIELMFKAKINIYDYMIESGLIVNKEYSKIDEYKLASVVAGLIAIATEWYNNGFRESVQEMAQLTFDLYKDLKNVF